MLLQVTHLGYYTSEVEAAQVHDRVALSLDNHSILNFDPSRYNAKEIAHLRACKTRPELQRALGVKPMDKSSRCARRWLPALCSTGCHVPSLPCMLLQQGQQWSLP